MLFLFLGKGLYAQYLYNEDFENITDWTVSFTGNNRWINEFGNDSIFGVEGKCILVSCTACNSNPLYEIGLTANTTTISMNSPITIPSTGYKIKFNYASLARPSADALLIEYSYDNSTWYTLSNLPMSTKWKTVSFPVTDLTGFTPGANVYFRFVLDIVTIVIPTQRNSCGIDNFAIVTSDWDITNISTTLSISNNAVLYLKNADYKGNNFSSIYSSGSFILDNGSDFMSLGDYFSSSADSIRFRGDKPQTFQAPVNSIGTFYVDKFSPLTTVLVDSFLKITDRLHFAKGILKTSAQRFPINLTTSNNPIASNDGFVDAPIKYYANITDRLFPTGNKGLYRPIILDNGDLHYTIRYRREKDTPTFVSNVLDSVSTLGYWEVRTENIGTFGFPKKTKISFKAGDDVYNVDSTRVAFSTNLSGPYTTDENYTLTHSGIISDGTVEVDEALEGTKYYIRLGYAKDGRINLNAMLQGALMDSTKVLWEQTSFSPADWNTPGGAMKFLTQADSSSIVVTSRPWRFAFYGLACVNNLGNTNRWANSGSGNRTATMNADVPISFSASEKYYVEFEYLYIGNASNYLVFQYSVNGGGTWNDLALAATPPTEGRWERFRLELNSTNFPGFIKGSTPIRFGYKVNWGAPNITDNTIPAPLIDNLRIIQKLSQPEEMTTYLSSSYMLDSLIGSGIIQTSYKAPVGAVDIIQVEIRNNNTSSYTVMDSQWAWLMKDGSIKSLSGSNFLRFIHRNSGTGYMVIKHRNHLPVMTSSSINFAHNTETTVIDFTDITNIMDATAYQYSSGPDQYALYLGNATEDFPNLDYYETNASDFFVISSKVDQLPDRKYLREDLNLDGYVNAEDFDLVQLGNNNIYFTTVPEP